LESPSIGFTGHVGIASGVHGDAIVAVTAAAAEVGAMDEGGPRGFSFTTKPLLPIVARRVSKVAKTPGGLLYDAACVYCLAAAAANDCEQQEARTGQALALLRRSQGAGFFQDRRKIEWLQIKGRGAI
jgi:hypothetical protein